MRALTYSSYGDISNLRWSDVPIPTPKASDVLIRVKAVGLNDFDLALLKGKPYILRLGAWSKPRYPILGCDVAGIVEAVGSAVTTFKVGDRVAGDLSENQFGGFAEFVTAAESNLAFVPENITMEEAATLPHSGVLALQSFRKLKSIQKDMTIAVNGAGGGAGHHTIRLAKAAGLHVVAIDSEEKLHHLRAVGADEVMNYRERAYQKELSTYHHIIDYQAHGRAPCYYRALKENGRFIMIGGGSPTIFGVLLIGGFLSLLGSKKLSILYHKPNGKDIQTVLQEVSEGRLRSVIAKTFHRDELPDALHFYQSKKAIGKVVVQMDKS